MKSRDVHERLIASAPDLTIGPGSIDAVKSRARQRDRRRKAGSGMAALLVLGVVVWSSQFFFGGAASTVDVADQAVVEDALAGEAEWTTSGTLRSSDIAYAGSFSVPAGRAGDGFGFGGGAIAYNPAGGGSLFITGTPDSGQVAEISIPEIAPHEGSRRRFSTAEILQPLTDITGGRGDAFVGTVAQGGGEHFQVGGLQVVEGPEGGRLHWTAWRAFDVTTDEIPGHGHSSLDFTNVDAEGPWVLSDFDNFVSAGYLFDVPADFANSFLDGRRMLSGFQLVPGDGDTSAGPPFISFDPPSSAPAESRLDAVALANFDPAISCSGSFAETAVFPGADWVSTPDGRHSIVAVGNSMRIDPSERCQRGSTTDVAAHAPQIVFYDPADLAAVASGTLQPDDVEPELSVSLAADFIPTCGVQVGGVAFDAENSRLFIVQTLVGANDAGFNGNPVIHVFNVG